MSVTVCVSHTDGSVKRQRHARALNVIDYFGDAFHRRRVKVLLDHMDWDALKAEGPENRGAFFIVNHHHFDSADSYSRHPQRTHR